MTDIYNAITERSPREDQLQKVRAAVAEVIEKRQLKIDLEERLKTINKEIYAAQHETLPSIFNEVRCDGLKLPPEGNRPGYEAVKEPYFKANISADWPIERQEKAFEWLQHEGHSDIIKTIITIELGRGERGRAAKIEEWLRKQGIEYSSRLGVAWNTLTALLRDCYKRNRPLSSDELEIIGANVGEVVNLKPLKGD